MLILFSIPGVAVIIFTLLLERSYSIKQSELQATNIANRFSLQQKNMLDDIERLARYIAQQESKHDELLTTCPDYFELFKSLYNNVANIGMIDLQGNVSCATSGQVKNINIADRDYFKNALNSDMLSVGYFQLDRSLQTTTVNFALSLKNTAGVTKGAVIIVIALDWWNAAINEINLPDGSLVAIVDSNTKILAHYPKNTTLIGNSIAQSYVESMQADSHFITDEQGVTRIFSRSTIYNDPHNNNLDIYIGLPVTDVLAQINHNFIISLTVFIIFLLLLTFIAYKLLKVSIFTPINNLTKATDSLANGVMPSEQNDTPNSPELKVLYQRFKIMAETRLATEANLKNKHDELTSLLSALPDSYLKINNKGGVSNIGGSFNIPGVTQSVNNLTLASFVTERNAQLILNNLPTSTSNNSNNLEFTLQSQTDIKNFEARINPMQTNHEFVVVLRDITQRKQNEEALHLAALVYGNSSEGMAITDENGIIFDVNPAFSKTTLFSKEEVINKTISVLSSGKHDKTFYQALWAELTSTGRWQGEIINRRKNGELYVEWLTIDTVYDDNNMPVRRIAIFTDLTEKKQADALIWKQAHFDHLTDLPNRLELKKRLNECFTRVENNAEQLVIMLLDIDHFKDVNDTLGHHYGDALLKFVSQRILESAKNAEFVARIGGDEFVIVFSKIKEQHIKQIAENILLSLSSAIYIENEELFISASIGIASAPNDGENTEQILKAADQAMYKAKVNGRNGFEFFSHDMREKAQMRMLLLKELRTAIELEQFELFYQPIVCLKDLHVHKAEGLIRWRHPEKGLISPADFIPLAEETRQINILGQFVFSQALQTLNDIKAHITNDFQLSVNVSPIQLSTPDSGIDEWGAMLNAANLPASSIVAEITEGLMVNPEALTQSRLKALVQSGMQLALDDFGTGYSSLAYLQEMDTDYLKIDKRFVDNINKGSQELVLCETIIVMAHQLGLKVIAEGIETKQQMQLLLEAGCDYGQGYLFSKPLPKEQFMSLLTTSQIIALK